ncbi:MAG TPA: cysteine desulfurase NifS [Candidatus Merdivicinus faecavium]|nr:cysteine desulfurase NifS [Candidatus Merdivicinus faecavium]
MDRFVYLDNSATTKISDRVFQAMVPYLTEHYGNPSSIYAIGREAAMAIEDARKKVAAALNARPEEIYFTGCGSESDNWAIKGVARRLARLQGKKHIITTVFEHHAVLHTCQALEREGFEVTYLPVDKLGFVNPADVEAAIRPDTAIVSVMYANNEIGTIQPIAEIGAICRAHKVYFHTDAVQAVGNVRIDVKEQNIDMLSLSAHKIHGPKGVGALYIRRGVPIDNFMDGGAQESGKRAGTENLASIVGLGEAITETYENFEQKTAKMAALRDKLIDGLLKIPCTRLNGGRENRLCTNVNISFGGIEGEGLLLLLDLNGIAASSGSACTSGSLDPSHVLLAIGLEHGIAHGSLRLSLSAETTEEDVDYTLETVPKVVERLRAMSPVWQEWSDDERAGKNL